MTRVLIVDDEPDILFLAKMMLEGVGHETVLAKSSKECFDRLKDARPDLILLDVMMPGEDSGWKTCSEIKEEKETRDIPIAMFTVRSSDDSVEKSYSCGADAHIKKPFYRTELLETIDSLVKDKSVS